MTTASPGMDATEREDFAAWLTSPVVRVVLSSKHGQVYAAAEDFGIAGLGETREAALLDVAGLVDAYLRTYYAEGRRYEDALRRRSSNSLPWQAIAHGVKEAVGRLAGRNRELVLPSALRRPTPAT